MVNKLPKKAQAEGLIEVNRIDSLYRLISTHIDGAHQNISRSINIGMVKTYWLIGKEIVEEEQYGEKRAKYGEELLKSVSIKLQNKYKRGFSVDSLELARKFFLGYQPDEENNISGSVVRKLEMPKFNLSWSHYIKLLRVSNPKARSFYEIEAIRNNWSRRELERQIDSMLFERLAKSKNKEEILKLAYNGHEINKPEDVIKEPLVLEFLGLPDSHLFIESKIEQSLISNLQLFLLELGKGFAFVARQKRLTLEGDHFYADLVFYHVILKCYIIIDIKTHALTHADLGQMLLYVNYFDAEIKAEEDNPTIGLVLCTEKSDAMVKYTLGEKAKQIFATKYQFHLPTEAELETELKREIKAIKGLSE